MYVLQSLKERLSVIQIFIFSLNIPSEFEFPMSLGASKDMPSLPKYTVRFIRLCSSRIISQIV